MADDRRVVIEIVAPSGGEPSASESMGVSSDSEFIFGSDDIFSSIRNNPIYVLGLYVAKQAAQDIYQAVENNIDWYFKLSEDYKSQNQYHNTINVISKFASAAGSILGGASFGGAVGGPIGAAIGAAAGLGQAIFTNALSAYNVQRTQNMQIASQGYAVEFNKELAGIVTQDSRGTEN